jgi:hypothetical protein
MVQKQQRGYACLMLLLLYYLGAQPQTGPDLALGAKYVPTTMQSLVQGFFSRTASLLGAIIGLLQRQTKDSGLAIGFDNKSRWDGWRRLQVLCDQEGYAS